jgi:hypothetical protein
MVSYIFLPGLYVARGCCWEDKGMRKEMTGDDKGMRAEGITR